MKCVVATTSYPRSRAMHSGMFVAQWREGLEAEGLTIQCLRPEGSLGPPGDIEYTIWGALLKGGGAPDMLSNQPIRGGINALMQSVSLARQVYTHANHDDLFVGHWLLPWGLFLPSRVPSHLYAHGSDIALLESMPLGVGRRIAHSIDRGVTGITFVSDHLRVRYLELLGRPSQSLLSTIPMGVYECHREESLYDELITFKGERVLAVAMGRHIPLKGFDILITSAQHVPNLCIALGGSGPHTQALKRLSVQLGVDVKWIGPFTPQQRVALLEAADVFVQPSRHIGTRQEGAPVTVREAINQGTPCLVSQTQGHLDLSHQGALETFPVEDSGALRDLLRRLCVDPTYIKQRKTEAAVFRHSLSWSKNINQHAEQLFKSAAQRA